MPPVLGTGPPTAAELEYYYPPMFSWETVKDQVGAGIQLKPDSSPRPALMTIFTPQRLRTLFFRDLGNLKRHPKLQVRYDKWLQGIVAEHGSVIKYLVNIRLGWAPTETRPATPLSRADPTYTDAHGNTSGAFLDLATPTPTRPFTPAAEGAHLPKYFTADLAPSYLKILKNDWPYSTPLDVTHFVFWSRVPIIHPDIVPSKIWDRIEQDGLWGFSGSDHIAVPKTLDEKDDEDTARMVEQAHYECAEFVNKHWPTDEWETAWFINPPRLQSIPGLAHGHVFARKK